MGGRCLEESPDRQPGATPTRRSRPHEGAIGDPETHRDATPFHLLRIGISTDGEAFIRAVGHDEGMRRSPQGPQIAVPNWLIVWSKSRDLFLSLAHNPWVYRPN